MTDLLATRPGYDWIGYPVETATGPRCGACQVPHIDVAAVRACYEIAAEQEAAGQDAAAGERAAERALEDRGWRR